MSGGYDVPSNLITYYNGLGLAQLRVVYPVRLHWAELAQVTGRAQFGLLGITPDPSHAVRQSLPLLIRVASARSR